MLTQVAGPPEAAGSKLGVGADHRIANHLAILAGLLHAQAERLRKQQGLVIAKEAALVLAEFEGRLETLVKLHRLLASRQEGAPIEIVPYLKSVATAIITCLAARDATEVRYEFEAPCFLTAEKAVSLGLLIGELITNAVKYAHPAGVDGVITISSSSQDGATIDFDVTDDGVGLPEDFDPLRNSSLGFRMVRTLAEQLGATLSFQNYGLGFNCKLRMPYAVPTLKIVS